MSNLIGGYQIIPLNGLSITASAKSINSDIRKMIANSNKPVVLTGVVVNSVNITPVFTTFNKESAGDLRSDALYVKGLGLIIFIIDTTDKIRYVTIGTLPDVTTSDNGKALVVKSGAWSKETIATLPTVTASDNGKILKVVNGAWAVVSPE